MNRRCRCFLAAVFFFALADTARSTPALNVLIPTNFDARFIDRRIAAADDLYLFASGRWIGNPVFADYDDSFEGDDAIDYRTDTRVNAILHEAASSRDPESEKIVDYRAACNDTKRIDSLGFAPLRARLRTIDRIDGRPQFAAALADLSLAAGNPEDKDATSPVFSFDSEQDLKDSSKVIGTIDVDGETLKSDTFYTSRDRRDVRIRRLLAYRIFSSFRALGVEPGDAARQTAYVLLIELALARLATPSSSADPLETYDPVSAAALGKLVPDFDWNAYFDELGLDAEQRSIVDVTDVRNMRGIERLFKQVPLAWWKAYLKWRWIDATAIALPSPMRNVWDDFEQSSAGISPDTDRSDTCDPAVERAFGSAIGKRYVRRYFSHAARDRARAIVETMRSQLRAAADAATWVGPQSKAAVDRKIDTMRANVGFPDTWLDYGPLKIRRDAFFDDLVASRIFRQRLNLAQIGKPVDLGAWAATPQSLNSNYDDARNLIEIPAQYFDKPYYDPNGPPTENFSGVYAVIGHEMSHAFDSSGIYYDANGNYAPILSPPDAATYAAIARCVAKQLGAYRSPSNTPIDGSKDVNEALADNGGVTLGYRAMEDAFASDGRPAASAGLTPEQRFFVGFAQGYRQKTNFQNERSLILTDTHPPNRFRVDGTVADLQPFYAAFSVVPASRMYRPFDERCSLW